MKPALAVIIAAAVITISFVTFDSLKGRQSDRATSILAEKRSDIYISLLMSEQARQEKLRRFPNWGWCPMPDGREVNDIYLECK